MRKSNQSLGAAAAATTPLAGTSQLSVSGSHLAEKNHPDGIRKSASCDLSQPKEKQAGRNSKAAEEGDKESGGLTSGGNGKAADDGDKEGGGLTLVLGNKDSAESKQQKTETTEEQKLVDRNVEQNKKEDHHVQNSD